MRYTFENCELDTDRHELIIGGEKKDVEPQVFDLLRLFAENPGELITHDRLIDVIWSGRIVSDSAISARISLNSAGPAFALTMRLIGPCCFRHLANGRAMI